MRCVTTVITAAKETRPGLCRFLVLQSQTRPLVSVDSVGRKCEIRSLSQNYHTVNLHMIVSLPKKTEYLHYIWTCTLQELKHLHNNRLFYKALRPLLSKAGKKKLILKDVFYFCPRSHPVREIEHDRFLLSRCILCGLVPEHGLLRPRGPMVRR